jgi:hypothetical protein
MTEPAINPGLVLLLLFSGGGDVLVGDEMDGGFDIGDEGEGVAEAPDGVEVTSANATRAHGKPKFQLTTVTQKTKQSYHLSSKAAAPHNTS